MIADIKSCIAKAVKQEFPDMDIYDEEMPPGSKLPAILMETIEQEYGSRIGGRYKSTATFSLTYIPRNGKKKQCIEMQNELLRLLSRINAFRCLNKSGSIDDDYVKITFDVSYSEKPIDSDVTKMNQMELNSNIE